MVALPMLEPWTRVCVVLVRCGPTYPKFHFYFFLIARCPLRSTRCPALRSFSKQESRMQRTLLFAVVLIGLTAAHAQTGTSTQSSSSGGAAVASDPLSVPTSARPSQGSSLGVGGSTIGSASTGTASVAGASASIAAPASINPQSPLQLPGEAPGTSTQGPTGSSAAAAAGTPLAICGPPVPSTDGGSANITDLAGSASLGGC
jgi:hypothetical protein